MPLPSALDLKLNPDIILKIAYVETKHLQNYSRITLALGLFWEHSAPAQNSRK